MIAITRSATTGLGVSWRLVDFLGCAVVIFLYTGAFFPVALSSPDGSLDPGARALLRQMLMPAYAITLALLLVDIDSVVRVARRNLVFTFLLVLPFVSVAWSVSGSLSLRRAVGFLLSILLAYLLAARFTPRRLLFLVATVLGVCMAGSLLAYIGAPGMARMPGSGEVRGLFLHKNVLGWYAAVSAILFSVLAFDRNRRIARIGLVMLLVSLACLFLSRSATGIFMLVVAGGVTVFYVGLMRTRGLPRLLLLLLFAQAVVVFLIVAVPLSAYVLEAIGRDPTLTGRVPLWAEVDEYIAERWLLGYGFQAFWSDGSVAAWEVRSVIGWDAPHAHNGVRDVFLSLGLVGLLPFLFWTFEGLRHGARLLIAPGGDAWLWLNLYAVTFIAVNLTESLYFSQNEFLFILFATALLMFCRDGPTLGRPRGERPVA